MKDRIKALLLAGVTLATLSSCKGNTDEKESESLQCEYMEEFESESLETAVIEEADPIESMIVLEESSAVEDDVSRYNICEEVGLNAPAIQAELAKIENGEPFQFTYVTGSHETHSHYGIMGPLFKQKIVDGKKCLVYASDENNILLSGYDYLGLPFYVFGYDKENGGKDEKSEYSGWVIPTYTSTEGDPY